MEAMRLDEPGAVERIAALLGAPAQEEPYRVREATVYRLTVACPSLATEIAVLLWPSLGRVDVRVGDSALVLKGVERVELYPGVEVMFRNAAAPAALFVAVNGRFGMWSGGDAERQVTE